MMKKTTRCKRVCFFTLLLLLLALLSVSAMAEETESKNVRVGWYEDSYNMTGENGERSGYNYEYEQAVAGYTGWTYDYVKAGWPELMEMIEKGEIDLMGDVSYTEERAEKMLYSALPMGEEKYYLYADLVNTDISSSDLSTLNGKRVALLEGSVQETQFYQWEKENGLQMQHVFMTGLQDAMDKVANHELDCIVSTETPQWPEAGMSAIATVGSSDIYFGINKKRPDLKKEIDNAMRKMEYDKPFYADDLYKKYLSAVSSPVLSTDEQEWVKNHGAIRIGWLQNDSGISVLDKDSGEVTGIIDDYIKAAADCLGNQTLEFELVGFDSQEEQMQALKNGDIDMIFHFSQNPYIAEENGFALSNTVLTINMAAVTEQTYFDQSKSNTAAIEKDNLLYKWYISYNYPDWKIVECDLAKDAENAVKKNQADCYVIESGQPLKDAGGSRLHSVLLTQPGNTSFAVKRENTVLLSILNKTLRTMSTSMLSGAISMYENAQREVTLMDFIKNNFLAVSAAFVVVVLLILIVILGLLKKARSAEEKAKAAQAQAESANAAKSNFLFNMSHDIRTPMNALLGYNQLMKKELTDPKLLHYQRKIEQSGNLLLSIINNVLDMARIESGKAELDENYAQVSGILDEIVGVFAPAAKKKGIELTYEIQVEHQHIVCDATKVKQIFVNLVSNAVKYTPPGGKVTLRAQEMPCDRDGYIKIKAEVADTGIGMSKEFLPSLFSPFSRERNTTIGRVAGTGLGMPIVKELVEMMGGSIEVESELGAGSKFTVILPHKIADEKYYIQKSENLPSINTKELLRGKHILLAEDNDLNAEIAVTILEDMGLKVDHVEDGIQCVSKMEQMPAGSYDLILMDIQMPNMDGYKATGAIRRLKDKDKANIPIVAMTANAFEEDKKMALSKGMNAHISKPIDVEKVERVLISILK